MGRVGRAVERLGRADERVRPVWCLVPRRPRSVTALAWPGGRRRAAHEDETRFGFTRKQPTQQQQYRERGLRQQGRKLRQGQRDARLRVSRELREPRGLLFECL